MPAALAPTFDWGTQKFASKSSRVGKVQVRPLLACVRAWQRKIKRCAVVWLRVQPYLAAMALHHLAHHRQSGAGAAAVVVAPMQSLEKLENLGEVFRLDCNPVVRPLAPISAAAELIGIARLDEASLKQTSAVITRQVRHMTSLVDDLLDVSRVSRGLVTINPSPHTVKSIVSNAVEQVHPILEARRHRLLIDLAPESGHVLADQKRLVQILANLLNNAAKFTPVGGKIQLRTEVHEENILLIVQDNGIGIAPQLQPRVFDLFAQAERTSDRSLGGLGLGLALVKNLVASHGGKVACFSEGLGKGSVFTVTLPHFTEQNDATDRQRRGSNTLQPARKLRILVVDDNVDAAQMLALVLQASGHEVLVEHASLKALERARIELPDVCVLDIGMPEMNGNELARQLRSHPETSNTLLIAVTGYGQEHDREIALAAGFNNHFVKPVDMEKLTAVLDAAASARMQIQ
jgi:CheY-like chemotaxis protein